MCPREKPVRPLFSCLKIAFFSSPYWFVKTSLSIKLQQASHLNRYYATNFFLQIHFIFIHLFSLFSIFFRILFQIPLTVNRKLAFFDNIACIVHIWGVPLHFLLLRDLRLLTVNFIFSFYLLLVFEITPWNTMEINYGNEDMHYFYDVIFLWHVIFYEINHKHF